MPDASAAKVPFPTPELGTQERTVWIRAWAEGWLENLKGRPAERYYADLPLEVACDMILELTEKP